MFFIQNLEIGLWNAWIFTFFNFIAGMPIMLLANRKAMKKAFEKIPIKNNKEKINYIFCNLFYWVLLIFSIFVPLQLGTIWFYIGLFIGLIGAIMHIISVANFVTTPPDELVIKGFYRISRNPVYFSVYILFIGASIASTSLILFVGTFIWMISQHFIIIAEEHFCLERYGDSYREYMSRIPRYIGIPKKSG